MSASKTKTLSQAILDRQNGFTIVELLIVIVVLGILAAIVLVGYNGISKKAQYTSIAHTAKQHVKILGAYKVDKGNYPGWGSSSSLGYCMGEGYPNYDGDPAGDCINDADFSRFNYDENAALNTELKKYTNSLPVAQREGFSLDGHRYNGISYVFEPNTRIDGVWGPQGVIFYYLPGTKQDCQIPVLRYVGLEAIVVLVVIRRTGCLNRTTLINTPTTTVLQPAVRICCRSSPIGRFTARPRYAEL